MDSRSNAVPAILNHNTNPEAPVWAVVCSEPGDIGRVSMDQHALEAQKLASTGALASRITHEFNNLLTAILGNAALGQMDAQENTPTHRCFKNIERTAQRAAELCQQLTIYNRREEGKVELADPNGVIEQVVGLLRLVVGKGSTFETQLTPDLPAVEMDVPRIHQVLIALVMNAVESLPGGKGTTRLSTGVIRVDAEEAKQAIAIGELTPGDYVFLEISDNGSGVTPAAQARLFEPFYSTKGPGRGLGLAATHNIVRRHQGALKIDSAPGRGTTVRILLPCRAGDTTDCSGRI